MITFRTYASILKVFSFLKKEKLRPKDIRDNFEECNNRKMKDESVYQTLSRAVRDGILRRDEYGFYYIVDKEKV